MSRFTEWLHANGERLVLGALAIVALVISLAVVIGEWLGLSYTLREHLPAGILVLLATYVLFFLFGYERRIDSITKGMADCKHVVELSRAGMSEHAQKLDALGVAQLYPGRNAPGQIDNFNRTLASATKELFIVGITLKDLTRNQRPLLLQKALEGCSVQLLMLTPARWPNRDPVLDPIETGDLKDHFTSAIRNIRDLANELTASAPSRQSDHHTQNTHGHRVLFEVRFYNQAPALSMAVADGTTKGAQMRVEFTPHNETDQGDFFRPMMDLVPAEKGLLRHFYANYKGLWEKCKDSAYIVVRGNQVCRSAILDTMIHGELGLSEDWIQPHRHDHHRSG